MFEEHGPIYVDLKTYKIKKRKQAWTKQYNVLYLDPTTFCGFSYSLSNYPKLSSLNEIGIRIRYALQQFLLVFPEMQNHPMYLTGEFDSGKYITLVAKENLADENPQTRLNIHGLMIGKTCLLRLKLQLVAISWQPRKWSILQERIFKPYPPDQLICWG